MMNTGEALKAIREFTFGNTAPERELYKKERARITGEFKEYLADEYASHLPVEMHPILWDEAWERGHDSGFSEVELHYSAIVDFTDRICEHIKK